MFVVHLHFIMGIIQRQSIKGVIVFIIGAGLHFFVMLCLLPNVLTEADFAVYRVYFSLIMVFSMLGIGGVNSVVTRHFHDFNEDALKLKVFNFVSLMTVILFGLISVCAIYLSKNTLYALKHTESPYLLTYFYCVPISTFFLVMIYYFESYSIATHRLTAPSVVKEILMRLILLAGVGLYYYHIITIYQFFILYALSYVVGFVILMIYCIAIRGYRIAFDREVFNSLQFKSYLVFASVIFLIGLIGAMLLNFDQVVVYGMLGSNSTLVYGHAVTTAALITIPYKPLAAILLPFAYKAWQTNDMKKLNEINRESAKYLSVLGAFLFAVLVANTNNIIQLAPQLASFKWPLIIIGFGRVLDYTTGISSEILLSSPSYKRLIAYMSLTFLFSLLCYKLLIPPFHEIGAAISCTLTLIFYNVLKFFHLKNRYQLQPITKESILFIGLGFFALGVQFILPKMNNFILDTICRSTLVLMVYGSIIYFANWLPEVNQYIKHFFQKKHAD